VEVDDAVGEGFGGEELEADGAMARLGRQKLEIGKEKALVQKERSGPG
jgi:hypothetical protein